MKKSCLLTAQKNYTAYSSEAFLLTNGGNMRRLDELRMAVALHIRATIHNSAERRCGRRFDDLVLRGLFCSRNSGPFTQTLSDKLYDQKIINPYHYLSIPDSFALIENRERLYQLSMAHGSEDAVRCGRSSRGQFCFVAVLISALQADLTADP